MNTEHQLKSKLAWSVSEEYEIEAKMVQEQWLKLKMMFLLGCNLNIFISGGNDFVGGVIMFSSVYSKNLIFHKGMPTHVYLFLLCKYHFIFH